MIKYKLTAVIPCVQYGNLQPEIELEGENIDELHATAMAHIAEVWGKYGERPLKASTGQIEGNKGVSGVELKTFTGETILWNESEHAYYDLELNRLLSGSAYADRVSPKFDIGAILPKTAKAWGVDEISLADMWKLQGDISNEYGSSIHSALDIYHKYHNEGELVKNKKELGENYALPKNTHISNVVKSFSEMFGVSALTEVLISDVKNKMAGRIDRLEIIDKDKKVCRIGDYKTNNELDDKKLKKYQHQLSFYAKTLQNHGWTVTGLDIFHYDGDKWVKTELDLVEVVV